MFAFPILHSPSPRYFFFFFFAVCRAQPEELHTSPDQFFIQQSLQPSQPIPSASASITPFYFFQTNDFQSPTPSASSSFIAPQPSAGPELSDFPQISQIIDPSPELSNAVTQPLDEFFGISPQPQFPEITPVLEESAPPEPSMLPSPIFQIIPSYEPIETPAEVSVDSQPSSEFMEPTIPPLESPELLESMIPEPFETIEPLAGSPEPSNSMEPPIERPTTSALMSSEEPTESFEVAPAPQISNDLTMESPIPSTLTMEPSMFSQSPQETMESEMATLEPSGPVETQLSSMEPIIPSETPQETIQAFMETGEPTIPILPPGATMEPISASQWPQATMEAVVFTEVPPVPIVTPLASFEVEETSPAPFTPELTIPPLQSPPPGSETLGRSQLPNESMEATPVALPIISSEPIEVEDTPEPSQMEIPQAESSTVTPSPSATMTAYYLFHSNDFTRPTVF